MSTALSAVAVFAILQGCFSFRSKQGGDSSKIKLYPKSVSRQIAVSHPERMKLIVVTA
jgi:hypothetical protein